MERTYIDMPHRLRDIIRARSVADLVRVAANEVAPLLRLEEPDSAREKARGNEVEEARGDDEEVLQFCCRAAPVHVS